MTKEKQIIAIAELDGINPLTISGLTYHPTTRAGDVKLLKPYLTSRDAIIPVIEKQPEEIQDKIQIILCHFKNNKKICYAFRS